MNDTISRRYAQALFDIADEKGSIDGIRADLATAIETLSSQGLLAILSQPSLTTRRRLALVESVLTDRTKEVRNCVRLMVEKRRVSSIPPLLSWFDQFADDKNGVLRATITTAVPLTDEERDTIDAALARRYGKTIRSTEKVDASILGGSVIRLADHIIDNSVLTQLETLGRQLASHSN